ncbi:MAG: KH domain-containing protein [Acidimicrobiales bacterium]
MSEAGLGDVGNVNTDDEDVDDVGNAGVGNTVGDDLDDMAGNRLDDMAGNRVEGGSARAVLDYIARSLAGEPDAVVVETEESSRGLRFRIHVAPGDMGRMIGRRGRVAQAIRTLVRVAGSREGVDTNVDFVDD